MLFVRVKVCVSGFADPTMTYRSDGLSGLTAKTAPSQRWLMITSNSYCSLIEVSLANDTLTVTVYVVATKSVELAKTHHVS